MTRTPATHPTPSRRMASALLIGLALFGCARKEPPPAQGERAAGPFVEIVSPAGMGSGEPSLAVSPAGQLGMSWMEPRGKGHALLWSTLTGETWSEPVTIAEGDSFFVNWADFPSALWTPQGVFVHWLWKSGRGTYAYGIRVALSADGGNTWSRPVAPHDDNTATEHGFVSMIGTGEGARLVWLDGRAGEGMEEEDPRRSMQLRSAVVGTDGVVRQADLLDDRVCDCCATAEVATPDGILVAYRDRSAHEIRDISLLRRSQGAWSQPYSVRADGWHIEGCPVNGPALDSALEHVALAWYTAANDTPKVYCALSTDEGRTFGRPHRLDEGEPLGRVSALSLGDGSALVTWIESSGATAEVSMRRVLPDGPGPRLVIAATSPARKSGFPRTARAGKGVFVAWTDVSDSSRVRVSRADVWAVASAKE